MISYLPWLITAFTVVSVYYLDRWENRYVKSVFDWVPAILLAYVIPALLSAMLGVDYAEHDIHQFSRYVLIPLAIVTVMSSLSVAQLKAIGWKPIAVFVAGSAWIALFPVVVGYVLLDSQIVQDTLIAQEYWKGLPPIVGSWIGGSTSQLVLKELVDCPEHIFLAILILDSVLVNMWTVLMFQGIKRSDSLNALLGIQNASMPEDLEPSHERLAHPVLCVGLLAGAIVVSHFATDSFVVQILLLSALGLVLGNVLRTWNTAFALRLGSLVILLVMAVLGLKLSLSAVRIEADLLAFLIVWLVSHFVFMLLVAKLLKVNSAWVPIASMANVGGIATAPAVTAAYEPRWMPHAILLAILSMATGTFWGMATIALLRGLVGTP